MSGLSQFHGFFKKEFHLYSASRLTILNRLLIGPVISLATTGILYAGFFRTNPNLSLAEMNGRNFAPFILFGFLTHTYLNAGYYFFSSKVIGEWESRTLPLLWMAPCNRLLLILSLYSPEVLRCAAISLIGVSWIGLPHGSPALVITAEIGAFALLLGLGMAIGFLRSGLAVLNQGKAELVDNAYLLFVFTSCPYIPKTLLPRFLRPLCEWNPAYHGCQLMRGIWTSQGPALHHGACLVTGLLFVIALCYGGWLGFRKPLMELAFG